MKLNIKNTLLLAFSFLAIFLLVRYVLKTEEYNNQVIKVQIILKNNCELVDDAFMVISSPSNKVGKFADGKTEMFLKRSSKVQLAANNKYDGFHYSSIPVKVEKRIILEANCDNSDRLDNIFDSLRNQFKK